MEEVMKKRIGSKLYDTETSELIADVGVGILYRKKTREREWFLLIDKHIEPLEDAQARALLGESSYHEKPPESKRIMIGVDRETHAKISRAAKKEGLPLSEFMRKIAMNL